VEKDAVFVPAGWDNVKKIAILYENMPNINPDEFYTSVVAKPVATMTRKIGGGGGGGGGGQKEAEVSAEDDQLFLSRHQQQQQASSTPVKLVDAPSPGGGNKPPGTLPTAVYMMMYKSFFERSD
jgi:dynein light intermediate chain 1